MTARPGSQSAPRSPAVLGLGRLVLVASGLGFPITQAVIARFGSRGAIVAEGVVVGLLVRDAALVATGTPRRLQRWPAMLLWLELIAVAGATITGVAAVARPGQVVDGTPAGRVEAVRRFLVGLLFGLHTYRFQVYLRPDRGLAGALGTGAPPEALRRR